MLADDLDYYAMTNGVPISRVIEKGSEFRFIQVPEQYKPLITVVLHGIHRVNKLMGHAGTQKWPTKARQ